MTDALLVLGAILLISPIAFVALWLFLPLAGALVFVAGLARQAAELELRRADHVAAERRVGR
jgi:CHASE2 domain-containing sensor protein